MRKAAAQQVVPNFSDPRLDGWVPLRQYIVSADLRYELKDIRKRRVGSSLARRDLLFVYYEVVKQDGERSAVHYFTYERPQAVDLRELEGLFAYAERIPRGETSDGTLVAADGGPPLDHWVVTNAKLTANNLDRLNREIAALGGDEVQSLIVQGFARNIAAAAYRLGRQAREDELDERAGRDKGKDLGGAAMADRADVWRKPALEEAKRRRAANPAIGQPSLASHLLEYLSARPEIKDALRRLKTPGSIPSLGRIEGQIRDWERDGQLTPRIPREGKQQRQGLDPPNTSLCRSKA